MNAKLSGIKTEVLQDRLLDIQSAMQRFREDSNCECDTCRFFFEDLQKRETAIFDKLAERRIADGMPKVHQ